MGPRARRGLLVRPLVPRLVIGCVMSNLDKLVDAFRRTIDLDDRNAVLQARYRQTHGWDSVAHMRLIGEIEAEFGVMLDTDDVIGMSSFEKACEILTRYAVQL